MKIIHLISGGDGGGAKTHVFHLLTHLGATEEVTMVCFREGPFSQEARDLGIRTIVIAQNLPKTYRALKQLIQTEGFQIIHCHGSRGNLMGALLKRSLKLPVVTTVHSDYRLDYMGRPFHRFTYGVINAIALRYIDYRIGVSDAMVDLLISRGFRPDRLFAIYNGLDFTPPARNTTRSAYFEALHFPVDDSNVVAGIAARLSPVKDIQTLIRAFALALPNAPQLRLLIAGDGELRAQLEALAKDLGVGDKICFAGWISDINSFYQAIDINTLTSLSETFPYALTEGAREHLATVASQVGGIPYLIDHGINGFLFAPGDAEALAAHLVTLANDPALRTQLGDALYEKASTQFSLEATRRCQIDIYETILRRRQRALEKKRDGVLICGAYGRENAGDDAILEAILIELRQIDRDLPIYVLSRTPKATQAAYRVNSIYTFHLFQFNRRAKKSTLYINGGGSLIQDVTSYRSLWFYLYTLKTAKKRGCKVIMYGCGIGPIQRASSRRNAVKVINRSVDVVTLRDPHSLRELEALHATAPRLILSADPTVSLPSAPPPMVDQYMKQGGLSPSGRYICFTVRKWTGFAEKVPALALSASYAFETYGLIPVFLPIEPRVDIPASQQVAALLKTPYYILEKTPTSGELIGVLSRMEIVVSMRLHALVFAARHGVPLVGISYDHKINAFLASVGQDLCIELEDVTSFDLCQLIDRAAARRGDTAFLQNAAQSLVTLEAENPLAVKRLLGYQ